MTTKSIRTSSKLEKETYWIFGGLRIPKSFDFAMRFMANLTDEVAGVVFDNKPFEGRRFWNTFKGALPLENSIWTPKRNDANTSSIAKAFGFYGQVYNKPEYCPR